MRKVVAILLLTLLTFNLLGYQLLYYYRTCEAKAEMKAYLRQLPHHKDLIQLSFSDKEISQLQWEEESEFYWKGEMYDVVQRDFSNGQWNIKCLPDGKESALLKDYLNTNKKSNDSKQQALSKLLASLYLLPSEKPTVTLPETATTSFVDMPFSISTISLAVQSPPPQFVA